jgi:hypothetical protein
MTSISGSIKVGKYEIEQFNGKNNFFYRRMQMKKLFISQKLNKVLAGKEQKLTSMKDNLLLISDSNTKKNRKYARTKLGVNNHD